MPSKDMTGVLFKNDKKEKETQPDFNGKIAIGGQEYRLAAWVNVYEKNGEKRKYFSIKASESDDAPKSRAADDDVPF